MKTAIITGASRGIGRAIALRLAREGYCVGLMARTSEKLREVADEVSRAGGTADFEPADFANVAAAEAAALTLAARLGGVDVLVHNAATFFEKPLADMTSAETDRLLAVNLTAPIAITRALLPFVQKSASGRIVFIGSTAASQGYVNQSAYVASKHALLGFARSLAIEVKPLGIHVHTVSPGAVDTELIKGTYLWERTRGQVMIAPDDVADAVAFLIAQPARLDTPEFVIRRFQ
jgi:NAD(P)-dependent dehydrogenase (short-subunit alcohol dehydrogenase family)